MVRNVHPENLRRADQKRALGAGCVGRDTAVEQARQHMAEGSKPAQDGRNQPAHQGTVPIGQHLQAGVGPCAVELVVKRALFVEDAVENIRRDPPRRETWHFGGTCESLCGHAGTLLGKGGTSSVRLVHAVEESALCHADMPDIRIGSGFFTCAAQSVDRTPRDERDLSEINDERWFISTRAGAQATVARGPARAG
jgi:hypothetical protein